MNFKTIQKSKMLKPESWQEAIWLATTYRWHPESAAPPVMGLVFADWEKGVEIFQQWIDVNGHEDKTDSIRIAIIEGDIPEQQPGYTIRISANEPDQLSDSQNQSGQICRMHPLPETPEMPNMLAQFKREYMLHGEYLLAPVIMKDDNQLWFNVNYGIIKRKLVLRHASEISPNDPDYVIFDHKPSMNLEQWLEQLTSEDKEQKH